MEPLCDLSYATDFVPMQQKVKAHNQQRRHELVVSDPKTVLNTDFFDAKVDNPYTIFHVFRGFMGGDNEKPTHVIERHWIQAPTTPSVFPYWDKITKYSGKVIVYVTANKVDALWNDLVKDHMKGELGFGLRCQTAMPQPKSKDQSNRMIAVHIGNVFDIKDVGRVLFNLNYHLHTHLYIPNKSRTCPMMVLADFANEASIVYLPDLKFKDPVYTIKPAMFEDQGHLMPFALFLPLFKEQAQDFKYKTRMDKVLNLHKE